jgi:uncharacterized protein YukE
MQRHAARAEADLFAQERRAGAGARAHDDAQADTRAALAELINHYERLMRESRRLIRRSDRAELDMNQMNRQLHELAQQLEYRATHDPLTGALNRGAVIDCATRAGSGRSGADRTRYRSLQMDQRRFRPPGRRYGDPDRGGLPAAAAGIGGRIGRVGGEEFSVVWPTSELRRR